MEYLLIATTIVIGVIIFVNKNHPKLKSNNPKSYSRIGVDLPPLPTKEKPKEPTIKYLPVKKLFTDSERSFLGVLDAAIGDKYRIMGKVRVADLITPENQLEKSNWWTLFNKVAAKHIDYVLCQKETLEVIAAIELDDSSHHREDRQERDNFVNTAFKTANVPLIRFKASRNYQVGVVRTEIELAISDIEEKLK